MILLAVTGQTWLVTFLGFSIVVLLLTLFVFVIKGLGAIMQHLEKKPAAQVAAPAVEPVEVQPAAASADDTVAVAYALHLFYGLHDADSPRLTLHSHMSVWNEKTFGINNLDR